MSVEQSILKTLHSLPAPACQEVLDFAEFLRQKATRPSKPLKSLLGLWADLDIKLDSDGIAEARGEMWARYPRDIDP